MSLQIPSHAVIADRVRTLIADQLGVEPAEVVGTATLAGDLHADSLDRIELTMAIEEEFGFEIPDEAAEKLLTVGEVGAYVEQRVRERG